MGIRSQVGIALKNSIAEKVLKEHPWLLTDSDEQHESEEGKLIIFHDVKWYVSEDKLHAFYATLKDLPVDDYLVVEVCPEFPNADDMGDDGAWADNPWQMKKSISVSVDYFEIVND